MKVLILILTIVFPDNTIQSKVFQAPSSETIKHCESIVIPNAIQTMKKTTPLSSLISGVCFEVFINLKEI